MVGECHVELSQDRHHERVVHLVILQRNGLAAFVLVLVGVGQMARRAVGPQQLLQRFQGMVVKGTGNEGLQGGHGHDCLDAALVRLGFAGFGVLLILVVVILHILVIRPILRPIIVVIVDQAHLKVEERRFVLFQIAVELGIGFGQRRELLLHRSFGSFGIHRVIIVHIVIDRIGRCGIVILALILLGYILIIGYILISFILIPHTIKEAIHIQLPHTLIPSTKIPILTLLFLGGETDPSFALQFHPQRFILLAVRIVAFSFEEGGFSFLGDRQSFCYQCFGSTSSRLFDEFLGSF
mmetsp:Transcript_7938/g.9945  ORF Transcript_7938/g.9945 Transcript_7938/m.9945 type:complete len:296 (+) Transcript_7938:409-1296(+)